MKLVTISDISHGAGNELYGQTGIQCGLLAEDMGGHEHTFHPLSYRSHKQRLVSYSSFGVDILAAEDADDRSYDLKMSHDSIFVRRKMLHKIFVDSSGLFETNNTVNETRKYRHKKTAARVRD